MSMALLHKCTKIDTDDRSPEASPRYRHGEPVNRQELKSYYYPEALQSRRSNLQRTEAAICNNVGHENRTPNSNSRTQTSIFQPISKSRTPVLDHLLRSTHSSRSNIVTPSDYRKSQRFFFRVTLLLFPSTPLPHHSQKSWQCSPFSRQIARSIRFICPQRESWRACLESF